MTGAGNDFVAVDNRDGSLDGTLTRRWIARVCSRAVSVGADGVLELRGDREHSFRMRYYNSDGGPADMCGNGGRCIAVFASMLGIVGREPFTFRSDAGVHRALVSGAEESRIWMTEPREVFLGRRLELPGSAVVVSLVDTGVPHAVELTETLDDESFLPKAPLVRSAAAMGPEGANYDLVTLAARGLEMRTWERGVEGETLACGTGAVAAAYVAEALRGVGLPVAVRVRSGLDLVVGRDGHGWWLQGEARPVYSAEALSL